MKRNPSMFLESCRVRVGQLATDPSFGMNGVFLVKYNGTHPLRVISSNLCGWDHVSVSLAHRCPTWDEMNFIKDLFFRDDECVFQLHPAKADYINCHPYCLHLWRPQAQQIPKPPSWMVGPAAAVAEVSRAAEKQK